MSGNTNTPFGPLQSASSPIEQRKGGVAVSPQIMEQKILAGYDIPGAERSPDSWYNQRNPRQSLPDSAYKPAKTDGVEFAPVKNGQGVHIAEKKAPEIPANPVFDSFTATQETLKDWLQMLGGAMLFVADTAKSGVQQAVKAGAEQAKPLAQQIGNELNLTQLWKSSGRESQTPKNLVTDENVVKFIATGTISQEVQEQKAAQLSYIRGKLGEISQRLRTAQVAREESDVDMQNTLRELDADPQAANQLAGAKQAKRARILTASEVANARIELRKSKERRMAQQNELKMPKGMQRGHKFNSRDDHQETRVGGAGTNIGG